VQQQEYGSVGSTGLAVENPDAVGFDEFAGSGGERERGHDGSPV